MGEKKIEIEKTVDMKRAAAFLRLLAAELEGTSDQESNEFGLQLHGFNKMKIGLIKQAGGQLALTLKVKGLSPTAEPPGELADVTVLAYRPFKLELKATFTALKACAAQATLPAPELLQRFLEQSQKLITFAGFGDSYYHDYWQACLAMAEAAREGRTTDFQERLAAINTIKKACHQRFK